MCIVFYTLKQPGYRLILAANRDEYLDRPATPAAWHNFGDDFQHSSQFSDHAWVLSGRDVGSVSGGTWLGMTSDLRIGAITNIRHPINKSGNAPSRGRLLKDYLSPAPNSAGTSVHDYLRSHEDGADQYEGFNLLLFDLKSPLPQVGYLTNRLRATYTNLSPNKLPSETGACTCGISNSPMDKPFEKVERGRNRIDEELRLWNESRSTRAAEHDEEGLVEKMMEILSQTIPLTSLADTTRSTLLKPILVAPDPEVPIQEGQTGRWYGTRVSTVILVRDDGRVVFVEKDRAVLINGELRSGSSRRFEFIAQT